MGFCPLRHGTDLRWIPGEKPIIVVGRQCPGGQLERDVMPLSLIEQGGKPLPLVPFGRARFGLGAVLQFDGEFSALACNLEPNGREPGVERFRPRGEGPFAR